MATSYDTINELFESKITDNLYVELSDEDSDADQLLLMKSALTFIRHPEVKLDRNDTDREFENDLPERLQEIIATGMAYIWVSRQILDIDLLKLRYTPSEWKTTSPASLLTSLIRNKESVMADFKRLNKISNFTNSSGGSRWSSLRGV